MHIWCLFYPITTNLSLQNKSRFHYYKTGSIQPFYAWRSRENRDIPSNPKPFIA